MDGMRKARVARRCGSTFTTAWLAALFASSLMAQDESTAGKKLYEAACATCHGIDGRGVDGSITGIDIALPDFTDCRFANREPNGDWAAITHGGGPARRFNERMPAFGDALTVEAIGKVLDHVRNFCRDSGWPRGELNLPRSMVTEKAYPEDEVVWTTGASSEGGSVSNKLVYERRFGARNQWELVVPLDFHAPDGGEWTGGIGDIAVGAKRAVYHSYASGTIFSVAGEVKLPTGDEDKGVGKGVTIIEPFVSFGQILPGDSFLQAQAGVEVPTNEEKAEREAFWRLVLGKSFTQGRFGRTWSPMVEILAVRELANGEDVKWDVLPQVQITLSSRQHVMANVGVRVPISAREGRSPTILVYLLWDWFDGGFLEGW